MLMAAHIPNPSAGRAGIYRQLQLGYRAFIPAPLPPDPHLSTAADLLLDAYIDARRKHSARAVLALLEGRADGSRRREEFRHRNLERIGEALNANAPHLRAPTLRKMAVVMLYHMRAIMAMTFDPNAPNAPGAPEELRISVRSWLAARLLPHNANIKRNET